MMMNINEFIQEAKRSIILANILPKGEHKIYQNPLFIQYSLTTITHNIKVNIVFDQDEMVISDFFSNETYATIDYKELTYVKMIACERIYSIPHVQQLIVLHLKTKVLDMLIETKDTDYVLYLISAIHKKGIAIDDPYGIVQILLKTIKEEDGYYQYMNEHYREIAKKYDLDLPRISVYRKDAKG